MCCGVAVFISQTQQQRGAVDSPAHEEELNEIQIRMQPSSNRTPSEPTPDRLSRASFHQSVTTALGAGGSIPGTGCCPVLSGGGTSSVNAGGMGAGASAQTIALSKPNSTSSTMTASVVVNLPASYPTSEVEPVSPASPTEASPEQKPEVRISTL